MDLPALYRDMARARAFELALAELWHQGLISGELHLGTGEEAIAAGVVGRLRDHDAMVLDHRCTPPLVVRGVPLVPMLREMLGKEDGICGGMGGHMHLMSREHLAASSGIVGAAGPLSVGMALAGVRLRPGSVALAFFGDGAANQGMVMEAMNLASAWVLPVVFVCKANGWAITTRCTTVTGGDLVDRGRAFGVPSRRVEDTDVRAVWTAAGEALGRAREGDGPSLIVATCPRLDGHLLGDEMITTARKPLTEGRQRLGRIMGAAVTSQGSGLGARAASVMGMTGTLARTWLDRRDGRGDPLQVGRRLVGRAEADDIDTEVGEEVGRAVAEALEMLPGGGADG